MSEFDKKKKSVFDRPSEFNQKSEFGLPSVFDRKSAFDRKSEFDRPSEFNRKSVFDRKSEFDRKSAFASPVSKRTTGDPVIAALFDGEAKALLFEVTEAKRVGSLEQLSRQRVYQDGTVIRVNSLKGMDIVEIDTSKTILGQGCECEIILLNVPDVIQPMKYPGFIGKGAICTDDPWGIWTGKYVPLEIEGIDYIKTYYSIGWKGNCVSQPILYVCDDAGLAAAAESIGDGTLKKATEVNPCRPFYFNAPSVPHYDPSFEWPPELGPAPATDLKNHCVYSMYNYCQAEIIKYGKDDGGTYFLWKAYTEWSRGGPMDIFGTPINFSRNGLGYLDMGGRIDDTTGKQICHADNVVKVDCCHKDKDLRKVALYWESGLLANCLNVPFMFYGSMKLCETPKVTSLIYLWQLWAYYYCGFLTIPSVNHQCIPMTWILDTNSTATLSDGNVGFGQEAGMTFKEYPECHQSAVITVKDRCGTEDKIVAEDCCTYFAGGPFAIFYDSLSMNCDQTQILHNYGGCGPWHWQVDFGTIVESAVHPGEAYYTAPHLNPNCTANPTIILTDCCGRQATIKLAINCSISNEPAFGEFDMIPGTCQCYPPYLGGCEQGNAQYHWTYDIRNWGCDGSLRCEQHIISGYGVYPYVEADCYNGWFRTAAQLLDGDCIGITNSCNFGQPTPCNTFVDVRTPDMLTDGCCPIDPRTGLPF